MSTQSNLVFLLAEKKLTAWRFSAHAAAIPVLLLGAQQLNVYNAEDLSAAWNDANERLQGEEITPCSVHWVLDRAGLALWTQKPPHAQQSTHDRHHSINVWQVLALEWVLECVKPQTPTAQLSDDWIQFELIPWLLNTGKNPEEKSSHKLLDGEPENEASLLEEYRRLLEENGQLHLQNTAMQTIDPERLVRFLPALFQRAFTIIGAVDLAILCGRITPFNLPNPYPEPSDETLRTLQQQFRSLHIERQKQIIQFVRELPQRQKLTPRPEMYGLVRELEGL